LTHVRSVAHGKADDVPNLPIESPTTLGWPRPREVPIHRCEAPESVWRCSTPASPARTTAARNERRSCATDMTMKPEVSTSKS
jgi:hypothetical protein